MAGIVTWFGAKVGMKLAGPLIAGAVAFGAGVVTTELYENKVPWGLGAQLRAARQEVQLAATAGYARGSEAQARLDGTAFSRWDTDLKACRAELRQSRNDRAEAIAAGERFTNAQAQTAYRLGRASCGGPRAQTSPPPGGPRPGSVPDADDDLADTLGPATYTAPGSPAVPGAGDRPPH